MNNPLVGINANSNLHQKKTFLTAAKKGDLETVKEKVYQAGCASAFLNQTNTTGKTALILAATDGHTDVVRFLCEQGANLFHRDHGSWAALDYAGCLKVKQTADLIKKYMFITQAKLPKN